MEYYKCSDGSIMMVEDFYIYLNFKKKEASDFVFDDWFDDLDFSSKELYTKIKNNYAHRTN